MSHTSKYNRHKLLAIPVGIVVERLALSCGVTGSGWRVFGGMPFDSGLCKEVTSALHRQDGSTNYPFCIDDIYISRSDASWTTGAYFVDLDDILDASRQWSSPDAPRILGVLWAAKEESPKVVVACVRQAVQTLFTAAPNDKLIESAFDMINSFRCAVLVHDLEQAILVERSDTTLMSIVS